MPSNFSLGPLAHVSLLFFSPSGKQSGASPYPCRPKYRQQTVVVMVIPVLYKPLSACGTGVRRNHGRLALPLRDPQPQSIAV